MSNQALPIDKSTYKKEVAKLREDLLEAQFELGEEKSFPVIFIMSGVNGAGKGEMVNTLNAWMDPRNIHTHALGKSTPEELERPAMWKFWRRLPTKGSIGIFFGSWYSYPMQQHIDGGKDRVYLDEYLDDFVRFERMLADEGALIVKFWLHKSKADLARQFKQLESKKRTKWRVTKKDWKALETYDEMISVADRVHQKTSKIHAPWVIIDACEERARDLAVGRAVLKALQNRLNVELDPPMPPVALEAPKDFRPDHVLARLNLNQALEKKDYKKQLAKYQKRLNKLMRSKKFRKRSVVMVLEGNDAAGKGGAIRRVTAALDSRFYDIVPISAPSDEEKKQPYLWRFWQKLPRKGHITIFDRSWYGRVLVERVEGFINKSTWSRAYGEINDFEKTLALHGVIVFKFWLAISKDEQLIRFKDREATGYKRFKLTDDDWRNRDQWDTYVHAVDDMVEKTSTDLAPWTMIEANSKYFARIKILKTMCEKLESELKPPVHTHDPMTKPTEN